jgi:Domain of unknown function (DUF4266)
MKRKLTHMLLALPTAATIALLAGCAMQPPQPWEKGNLARKEMTMDSDPLDQAFTQHIYFSKESASGGYGVGGGGCGCN